MQPRLSATVPRRSSSRSTRFTVAREVPAISARCSCVIETPTGPVGSLLAHHEVAQAAADARVRVGVVRLDDAVARPRELFREQTEQHVLHARVLGLQKSEVVPVDGERLPLVERLHRGRAAGAGRKQRQLTERLARAEHVEHRRFAERRRDAGREASLDDEVEGLREVVAVEDDFTLAKRPAPRDGEDTANVLRRQTLEQRPLHMDSLCHRRDIRNVGRANDGRSASI